MMMKFPVLISISIFLISYFSFSSGNHYAQSFSSEYFSRGTTMNYAERMIASSRSPEDKQKQLFQFEEMASLLLPTITMSQTSNDRKNISSPKKTFLKNQVIAHRGAWKNTGASENSVASLKAAIALGCAGSETDLHMTNDGKLIIHHDADVEGIHIQKVDYKDLQNIRLSNGEPLPLLEDFLKIIKAQHATRLILEIKPSVKGPEWAKETVQKVISTVHQMKAQEWLAYISFDYAICKEVLRLEPTANVQYLNGDKSPEQLKADGIRGADYHFSVYQKKPEWIQSAKENNIDLNGWTVNSAKDMKWLLANGFEYITTNEPELLFEEIKNSPVAKGWSLKWSDEFNYKGLPDSTKWGYNEGGHGWGNNERQYYTKADTNNAIVGKGVLSIISRKGKKEKNDYTSARILSKGKATWTYGRIEVSAKLPKGVGLWPAIWMLGADIDKTKWPACGEIDIMEHVGHKADIILGTVHTGAFNHIKHTQKGEKTIIKDPYNSFNTYAIEWDAEKIVFFLNDTEYFRFNNEHKTSAEWPFDKPFFLIMNTAIGGDLGGKEGIDDTIFPAVFEIDYVRVFQR